MVVRNLLFTKSSKSFTTFHLRRESYSNMHRKKVNRRGYTLYVGIYSQSCGTKDWHMSTFLSFCLCWYWNCYEKSHKVLHHIFRPTWRQVPIRGSFMTTCIYILNIYVNLKPLANFHFPLPHQDDKSKSSCLPS